MTRPVVASSAARRGREFVRPSGLRRSAIVKRTNKFRGSRDAKRAGIDAVDGPCRAARVPSRTGRTGTLLAALLASLDLRRDFKSYVPGIIRSCGRFNATPLPSPRRLRVNCRCALFILNCRRARFSICLIR